MKREINTKFYTFSQNNSGGYFVENDKYGVCEYVIVEAQNADEANSIFENIGDEVPGFHKYCSCCGERWHDVDEHDGKNTPSIYSESVFKQTKSAFRTRCFIHYYGGEIKEVIFPDEKVNP